MGARHIGTSTQRIIASFLVLVAVVAVTAGLQMYEDRQKAAQAAGAQDTSASGQIAKPSSSATDTSGSAGAAASSSASAATSNDTANATAYKDGTYTAKSEYYVPHGYETIQVTLTLKGDVVTASSIVNSESNPESASFQEDFAGAYKSYVVGKNIDSINLSYVAGASDTTDGFNEALAKIQAEART